MSDFLKTIAAYKLELLRAKESYYENLKKNLTAHGKRRYEVFKRAISKPGQVNLIAEIKKASPSAGIIREDFEVTKIAKLYINNKAAAISVLTEDKYFLGSLAYLEKVCHDCPVPVLMKDFIIHEHQIYEGALHGANAVLLIVAMLSDTQLKDLMDVAHGLGLDCLVEIHDENELERALELEAEIIGVNSRNLRSLKVDVGFGISLLKRIPAGKVIVAESGLKTHDDIQRVQDAGAHAVLIGETFMRSDDIGAKIKEVMYGTH